ncbi:hypothetical protein CC99x_008655 [Candidatus Berkiella cookevillensis]|uniref:Haloacid dehalogenase-like hydrolase n=1 Tax=Candidatus Berkiella cookevillensis TaxID=437022 RepID=A0A0Q9YFN3_9GAMM|nr:hypothetical protein [Candidatus Berkiella cookevillensis]MCS5708970.1 hypothetical protein [Candidatus Berkiella cookevillensis]
MPSTTPTYLFCFDFDNTLVKGHFHNQLCGLNVSPGKATPEQIESLIKKFGILNKDELLKTFKKILENGHKIAITTWSDYPEVVVPTLKHIGLNETEIKQIYIASGLPENQALRKETHIEGAKKHFSIQDNAYVVLIDDDQMNVLHAQKNGQLGILVDADDNDALYLKQVQSMLTGKRITPAAKQSRSNPRQWLIAIIAGIAVGLTAWYMGAILWMAVTAAILTTSITTLVQKYFFAPKEVTPLVTAPAKPAQIQKPVVKPSVSSKPTPKPIIKKHIHPNNAPDNTQKNASICTFAQVRDASSTTQGNIISINGLPFYQSSGDNSAFPDTWFPFFGCLENDLNVLRKKGWYIKINHYYPTPAHQIPKDIERKMNELFPSYGSCNAGRELLNRFYNMPCLLLSSWLGGGLWKEERGQKLKAFLQEQYPSFYKNLPAPAPTFLSAQPMKTMEEVNQWLCQKAQVQKIEDLKDKLPMQIISMKIQDGATEKKTPVRKKVCIAELDSMEGQRLYNVRYKLQTQGKSPCPARADGEQSLRRYHLKRKNIAHMQ